MAAQRDKNGRFVKGWNGGPGRPKRTTEERYIAAMVRTVRMDDWEKIVLTGIARAKAGDLGWAKFIADYLVGKPLQRTEVSGPGGNDLTLRIEYVNNWRDTPTDAPHGSANS